MSESQNLSEHTVQKNNMAMMDPTYLKLRLDTQQLHRDVLNFLKGEMTVLSQARDGTYFEEQKEYGSPRANDYGVQAILSLVVAVVNPHTIQGNTDRKILNMVMSDIDMTLIRALTVNYEKWGIDPDDRELMISTVISMVHLVLTRTIDNEERKGLGIGIESFKTAEGKTKEKKFL